MFSKTAAEHSDKMVIPCFACVDLLQHAALCLRHYACVKGFQHVVLLASTTLYFHSYQMTTILYCTVLDWTGLGVRGQCKENTEKG